ncbi:MAG: ThuA domain-containing protein [Pseudomonadota bacterium]
MITSILSGGYAHPFAETGGILKEIAQDCGCLIDMYDSIADPLDLSGVDVLIVNGLWWSMTQHEKYAPDRDAWAFEMTDQQMDEIESFVHEGGALYAVHTSVICFDTQPRWKTLLGGGWTWGHSHHPPLGNVDVTISAPGSHLGLEAFAVQDEVYHHLDPASDAAVLATSDTGEGPQPVAWVRRAGDGYVAVNTLGHDARSMNVPGHRLLMEKQLYWLVEQDANGEGVFS